MNTGRNAAITVLACMLAWSCTTTGARRGMETTPPPQQQEDGAADTARAPEPQPESEPQPEPAAEPPPADVSTRYVIPDGWDAENQADRNQVLFVHRQTGARITFTIWPASRATPQDFIEEIWSMAANDALSDTALEVNMPMSIEVDGRNISMFTLVHTQATSHGELRVTTVFYGFESNLPHINILLIGLWPESLDGEMMPVLQEIGRGITFSVPDR